MANEQPQMIVDKYTARKAAGKVKIIRENEQILVEQPVFDFAGDKIGMNRFQTNKSHLVDLKFQLQQQLNSIDLETHRFLAQQEVKKDALEAGLAEYDAMIADVEALTPLASAAKSKGSKE